MKTPTKIILAVFAAGSIVTAPKAFNDAKTQAQLKGSDLSLSDAGAIVKTAWQNLHDEAPRLIFVQNERLNLLAGTAYGMAAIYAVPAATIAGVATAALTAPWRSPASSVAKLTPAPKP